MYLFVFKSCHYLITQVINFLLVITYKVDTKSPIDLFLIYVLIGLNNFYFPIQWVSEVFEVGCLNYKRK